MCGIAGYYSERDFGEEVLKTMTRALRYRGPDAEGFFNRDKIHFGHRRLSVIDVAGSIQPLFNEDNSVALVFNGEIYNFQGLRKELTAAGHSFRTHGDSEVLVHAYEQYGHDMLTRLSGMFAFAIWDEQKQSLFVARDHLGVKPLYYYWDGSVFVFGSELKAILHHPAVRHDIDPDALGLYLECQYIPAPRSVYKFIKKLKAGHFLALTPGKLCERQYWIPDYSHKLDIHENEAVDLVEAELRKSVGSMLVSDVPLGAFVSGGIDSSLIAALMTDCLGKPVDTFNLGFAGTTLLSEHKEAQSVAKHIGSRHHALMIEPSAVLNAFESWVDVFDEPFGDQAALPTLLLSQLTRQHVTVVLTGEGADEVFAGYSNYRKRVREDRLVSVLGHKWSPLPHIVPRLPPLLRKDRILKAVARPRSRRYVTIPNIFDESLRQSLLTDAFRQRLTEQMSDYAEAFYRECNSRYYIDKIMYVDARLWLPDDLLTKVDRATMAHSLEARVPYLDHRFVETCARLDPGLKQRDSTQKHILKKVAEKYLPQEIVHRSKQGFVMPLHQWLGVELKPYLHECLSDAGLLRRNLFKPAAVRKLLDQHHSGRRNHSTRLWALLVLELWFRRYEPDFVL
jgi:asparagine synthase (glutamine-hydrolysing)